MYVGPIWKYPFLKENTCYGTTKMPLSGLIACKRMLKYFIENILNNYDIIEVSGSTLQRDIIYEKSLKSLGFKYTSEYNWIRHILIFVKDPTPEKIINEDGEQILNPENAWTYLALNGVDFPAHPNFDNEDYGDCKCLILQIFQDFKENIGKWIRNTIK